MMKMNKNNENVNKKKISVGKYCCKSCIHAKVVCYERKMQIQIISDVVSSQLTFTCSKSTIETLEKGIKYVQS